MATRYRSEICNPGLDRPSPDSLKLTRELQKGPPSLITPFSPAFQIPSGDRPIAALLSPGCDSHRSPESRAAAAAAALRRRLWRAGPISFRLPLWSSRPPLLRWYGVPSLLPSNSILVSFLMFPLSLSRSVVLLSPRSSRAAVFLYIHSFFCSSSCSIFLRLGPFPPLTRSRVACPRNLILPPSFPPFRVLIFRKSVGYFILALIAPFFPPSLYLIFLFVSLILFCKSSGHFILDFFAFLSLPYPLFLCLPIVVLLCPSSC